MIRWDDISAEYNTSYARERKRRRRSVGTEEFSHMLFDCANKLSADCNFAIAIPSFSCTVCCDQCIGNVEFWRLRINSKLGLKGNATLARPGENSSKST